MTTIEVLVCTINKGIVRLTDNIPMPCEGVSYIVSYQYTDERYLELISSDLTARKDITLVKQRGKGLSANRNFALRFATADIILFADDDARFNSEGFEHIRTTFEENPDIDVAFFRASTYTGRQLKNYPKQETDYSMLPVGMHISTLEKACRRTSIQGRLQYDERFGLGTEELICGEEEIWLTDAFRLGLKMRYFPYKIVETSTMLKQQMVYVDNDVQHSYGAITYYRFGKRAWWICFKYAINAFRTGKANFFPLLLHLFQGIRIIMHTPRKKQ